MNQKVTIGVIYIYNSDNHSLHAESIPPKMPLTWTLLEFCKCCKMKSFKQDIVLYGNVKGHGFCKGSSYKTTEFY